MESERTLERERKQIVEAMDWIDQERKRISRFCFSETRKKWHGQRERGRRITLMKKRGEWLYRRRCRLRERIGQVNAALKEMRRARSGRASEGFGSAFVEAARERLDEAVFAELMDEATRRVGGGEKAAGQAGSEESGPTVLEELRRDMEAFMASNEENSEATASPRPRRKETQADFGIAERGGRRIYLEAEG